MAYRSIEPKIWQDSKFRKLSKDCKLLFFYLITNKNSHYSGIYYIPTEFIEYETGISREDIEVAIKSLVSSEIVMHDSENSVIWVINMAKYQCKGNSDKLIMGIVNYLVDVEGPLVEEFRQYYSKYFGCII